MKFNQIVWLVLIVLPNLLFAQNPGEEFDRVTAKYPNANAVFLKDIQVIDIKVVADSLVITSNYFEERIYLGENPSIYSKDKVYSSTFLNTTDIDAYTLIPGKRKYEEVKVEDFKESYEMESYVFYNDGKETAFNYPSLVKGSKTVLKYKRRYTDPHMLGLFYFQSYLPVEEASFTVIFDPQVKVESQFFNDPNGWIKEERKTLKDGRKMITCTAKNVPKINGESGSPSFNYLAPSAYYQLMSFTKSDGSEQPVLSETSDLYNWYKTFTNHLEDESSELDSVVATIVTDKMSQREKIRAIYYWVQANVKYIAFEDGMRGFVPHPGAYVFQKRYGDCKDMSSLIISLLRAAGIEAYYTWIGSRDLPYTYTKTPSPITDNHMIATTKLDGEWYFLDATGSYTPMGMPTSMIQGKECLVDLGDSFELVEVPIIPKNQNIMVDSVYFNLEDGNVKGSGQVVLSGYPKVFNNYRLIKSSEQHVENYLNRLLSKGSNKFLVRDYKVNNLDQLDIPTEIDYSFTIDNYYNRIGDDIYVNLVLDQSLINDLIENREVPRENDYKYINQSISALKLPEGMQVSYLPEDESHTSENFGYNLKYSIEGDVVVARKEFYVNYLILQTSDFDTWNTAIKKYSKACRNAITLTKNTN